MGMRRRRGRSLLTQLTVSADSREQETPAGASGRSLPHCDRGQNQIAGEHIKTFDFIRLREHKIHRRDYLPARARLRTRKRVVAAWWGTGGGRPPSLQVSALENS